ncbi:MAG: rod shape-determining protein MreC [Bacillota bacterium]
MARFFRRNARLLAAVGVVVVLVALMNVTSQERHHLTFIEQKTAELMAPAQRWSYGLAQGVRGWVLGLGELRSIRADNDRLKQTVADYAQLRAQLEEYRAENERLKALLDFKTQAVYPTVAARVIARNPDSWFSLVILDKGRRAGLSEGMPVMTPSGLVGKVTRVTDTTATVLLLLDPESGAGGLVQRTRDTGVVLGQAGTTGNLQIKFFSREAKIEVGDDIVSSGLGGVFPAGLPIGRVAKVDPAEFGLVQFADVKPAVDFMHLEDVLVMTQPPAVTQPSVGGEGP